MTDERRPVVAGVDTHKDTHYAAVISVTGEHLAAAEFPATQAGYQALQWFITCHGVLVRAGVEGTNSYGAGLSRHLHDAGVQIVEVIRSSRQIRRMRGKSDEIDAYAAAHIALAATNTITAKTGTGNIEAIRVIHAARRSAEVPHRGDRAAQVAARDRARAHPRRVPRPNPPPVSSLAWPPHVPGPVTARSLPAPGPRSNASRPATSSSTRRSPRTTATSPNSSRQSTPPSCRPRVSRRSLPHSC